MVATTWSVAGSITERSPPDAAPGLSSLKKIKDFLYLTARTICLDHMETEKWTRPERVKNFYHNLNPYDREQVGIFT
jgi:hypothetical protein